MRLWSRLLTAMLVATAVSACGSQRINVAPVITATGVRFRFADAGARSVAVAGTFNQWSVSAHPLTREGTNRWTLVVPLPPGEHLFMFVIDGERWITPPLADDFVDDGFGSRNGVVVVRPR
jgi:1,4-alpha-glucan branching enzyme